MCNPIFKMSSLIRCAILLLNSILIAFFGIVNIAHSHGTEDHEIDHEKTDTFIADLVRRQEQQNLNFLSRFITDAINSKPIDRLFTELVESAIGKQVNAEPNNSPAFYGQWSAPIIWPFAFASAANLPDGRILAWGGNNQYSFNGGNFTYAGILDPVSGQITSINNTTHSMFCGIPVLLENGKVFVSGGNGTTGRPSVKGTSTFDFTNDTWTRIQDLAVGRWYNGAVAMPNGKVFVALGTGGSQYPEIWTEGAGWSYLNGASLQSGVLNFPTITEPKNWLPHFHLSPNGKIFHSGHTPDMHYIDPTGIGSVTPVGLTNDWNTANTPSILYDEGVILQSGGALYQNGNPATTKSLLIDLRAGSPAKEANANMHFARIFHNEVVLPNGEVMAIGGNTTGKKFSDIGSQMTPEIWNPTTKTWRKVADISIPRNYHSVALLMTDGRVWSGGGGLCDCSADHPDSQIYSPAYLFNPDGSLASRPEIIQAPSVVSYGLTMNVEATPGINRFTLVRMSSTTHALNSDMRFLNLPFTSSQPGQYALNLHTNRNVMTPGYWMLFALNEQGVPSIAKVIKVSTSNSPIITNPGDLNSIISTSLTFHIQASDPNGDNLSFNAYGLPQGLSINQATGVISGTPTFSGTSRVVITATDGSYTASTSFMWSIVMNVSPTASNISGSSEGTAFVDNVQANQFLTSLSLNQGDWISAIQGNTNTGPLAKHGGTGGSATNVIWPSNEYLVRIYGLYGSYIGQISLVTNTGRVLGPYGLALGGNDLNTFDISAPTGHEIVGFTGRADSSLNAIGVLHRPHQIINQPPVISTIGNKSNIVGETIGFQVSASDPDNDPFTYSAIDLPPGLSIDPNSGFISGTPTTTGIYDVIIQAQDIGGAVSTMNFQWSIQLTAIIIDQINTAPAPINSQVSFTVSASNGINPLYKWSFGDGTPETEYSSSTQIEHSFAAPGLFVVSVTATDDRGVSATRSFTQAIYLPHAVHRPTYSGKMAIATVNSVEMLWVVNQDNDSVSVFNTGSHAKIAEIPVGNAPRSIAVAPNGKIWVTNKGDHRISIIDPLTLSVSKTLSMSFGSQPYGIVFASDGSAAYVALEAAGKLLKLDPTTGAIIKSVTLQENLRHLAVHPDNGKVLVARYITKPMSGEATATVNTTVKNVKYGGEVFVVNTSTMALEKTIVLEHSNKEDTENTGAGIPNYLAMPAISPDGLSAWVPSKQDNIKRGILRNGKNLNFQNTVRASGSKIDLTTYLEKYNARLDFDNSSVGSAAAYDQSGSYLFVALETSRDIAVVDAYGERELSRVQVGRAPDGLIFSSQYNKLFVNNFMDRSISVLDLSTLLSGEETTPPVIATLNSVGSEKLTPLVLKGKQLFYDAKDTRLASDSYMSCASCHNEGGHDGRVWDLTGFGEGLRSTIDLRGHGNPGFGFLHWSSNFDEVQDFEGQIRSLSGGTGLMSDSEFAATQATLGTPKTGLSGDLDALAAYVNSLTTFPKSPYRKADGTLSSAGLAGKTIFVNAGCVNCHGGPQFTDSDSHLLHDIGTLKPSSGKRLNGPLTGIDTPTLKNVWNTAPYFHDGSAASLTDAVKKHNGLSTLTTTQMTQLVSYVRQIDQNEPGLGNSAPTVQLISPLNNSSFLIGNLINIQANPADNDGSIVKVEFYANGNLLATDQAAPFEYNWLNTTIGNFTLTAKAYDNYGAVGISSPINITWN